MCDIARFACDIAHLPHTFLLITFKIRTDKIIIIYNYRPNQISGFNLAVSFRSWK